MPLSVSLSSELESRIASRHARIGIIGMGYVGLPLTLLFSEQRFRVTGFDVDTSKVEALNSGDSYIVRIPGTEIVKRPGLRLSRHQRLHGDRRDGRHHHLRPHSARPVSSARPQLHRADCPRHRSAPPRRPDRNP